MSSRKTVAFYLPAYYPFPENDEFWGPGFTEWDNVKRAVPNYEGHIQPNIPAHGYKEFDNPGFFLNQMKLAQENSISAFCIYSYWFSGKRVMTRIFDYLAEIEETPIDFCIAWANENWTRRWDGGESDILIEQDHNPAFDANFIDDHLKALRHPNYLRLNGKLVLLIYRPSLMKEPRLTIENMRVRARELGLGELHLLMVQFFQERDPRPFGLDGAVQFPPNLPKIRILRNGHHSEFTGIIFDYDAVVELCLSSKSEFLEYQGVMPGWDNTPRKLRNASICYGVTGNKFTSWIRLAWQKMEINIPEVDDKVLFINAWNEWGEGAHLEPGKGDQFDALQIVKTVLEEQSGG
jgi:lipopolysaccharide biosynthesis protein